MSTETHATREECIEAGAFREHVVDETTDEVHSVRVRCPVCGREFEYVYDLVGLWDSEGREFVRGV